MSYIHPSEPEFPGKIAKTAIESQASWPEPPRIKDAPNIVLIVLDDTGFSHLGCYGSSIDTPNIDRLAARGLRYSGFHTTALCSPTRACLLTGRNHHAVGMRTIANFDTGFPNTRSSITPHAATVATILRDAGYATFATGKWHVAPMFECSMAGPFHNWPLQKGFDRFYGFLQGETNQFYPELTYDNHFVEPPASPEEGYHLSKDIVDHSLDFIRDSISVLPEKPWMLYMAMGAMHSPHQAPAAYLEKYRGKFDRGWEIERKDWYERQKKLGIIPPETLLAPLNPGVPTWDSLDAEHQRFASRLQEAFAAMLDYTDAQIGRFLDGLAALEQNKNTIIILLSDNGASQEGGASGTLNEMRFFNGMKEDVAEAIRYLDDIGTERSHTNIPWGWAQAGNTPLKWYKQNTHGGGVRDPLIVSWPGHIKDTGAIRHTFCHAVDIAPTIFDMLGLQMPDSVAGVYQMPLHGVSLKASFEADRRVHHQAQYFEMFGHRGIWKDGWKAVTHHTPGDDFDAEHWELYHLDKDFSEAIDLAERDPQKLEQLKALWWSEAEKYGVLPLDDRTAGVFAGSQRKGTPHDRLQYIYRPPLSHLVSDVCPPVHRGFTLTAHIRSGTLPEMSGVIVSRGTINSGFALYAKDGFVHFDYSAFRTHSHLVSNQKLSAGDHVIKIITTREGKNDGAFQLEVDGVIHAQGSTRYLLLTLSSNGMDFGRSLAPVNDEYRAPFYFTGIIDKVIFDIPPRGQHGEALEKKANAAIGRAIMAQQ